MPGVSLSPGEIEGLIHCLDSNGDGQVSIEEFSRFVCK